MSDIKFIWQGDEDDAKCRYGKYLLRAEKMDDGYWWWAVYEGDRQITFGYAHHMSFARKMAEYRLEEQL